jgi:hypothetical protein
MDRTIAIFGAGRNMGCRITDNCSPAGVSVTAHSDAVRQADAAVRALPDALIGTVEPDVVPAMVICLDPAAPHGGERPDRSDTSHFITHPCHPPVIHGETEHEAHKAKQRIVCALMQGPESGYAIGEAIARERFAPVMNACRVTVEQMATLEPALSETVREFILGRSNLNIGVLFGYEVSPFSDGALMAIDRGKKKLCQPSWCSVFEPEMVMAEIKAIPKGTSVAQRN